VHRGFIDAGNEQPLAVRRPPEAAHPVHLLGGDELGQAPRHAVGIGLDECPVRAAVDIDEPQGAARGVGDMPSGRVGSGVDDGRGRWQLPGTACVQVREPRPAGQGEGREGVVTVHGVADDATGALAGTLAPRPLLGG
jgi:hypothetical protein